MPIEHVINYIKNGVTKHGTNNISNGAINIDNKAIIKHLNIYIAFIINFTAFSLI